MRLFIGCELSDEMKSSLSSVISGPGAAVRGVKWVAPEGMHVTLKFLGEVGEEAAGEINTVLRQVISSVPAFDARFSGLGTFPSRGVPSVIWAGVRDGTEAFSVLQAGIENALEPAGFERDNRRFSPHVTLARTRRGRRPSGIKELLAEAGARDFGSQYIGNVSLIRSTLLPEGAQYEPVHIWPLKKQGR